MPEEKIFSKPPFQYDQLINKLEQSNLVISDKESAKRYLQNIGYYRLRGYGLPFLTKDDTGKHLDTYADDVDLKQIIEAYIVDRKIRTLLMSALERVEVSIRSIINHELACKYGSAHWFLDDSLFKETDSFRHQDFLREIKRSVGFNANGDQEKESKREGFINHYYSIYTEPDYPPCWMLSEVLSLGSWSKVYEHLGVSKDRKIISRVLDLPPNTLQSWLHSLTYLRNMCAHHARLFGRKFVMPPNKFKNIPIKNENFLYNYICVVYVLLRRISPETKWLESFSDEIDKLDKSLLEHYGFKEDWLEDDFWYET